MRVALCTRNPANPVLSALVAALARDGIRADVIDDPRRVLEDHAFDAAYWRPDARDASVAAFSRQAATFLDGLGVPFLNSLACMERSASKVVSGGLFARAGLPVPEWWIAPRPGAAEASIAPGPKIVKPVWGRRSRDVAWREDVDAAIAYAQALGEPCVVQQPVAWRRQLRCVVAAEGVLRTFAQENPEPGRPAIVRFDRFDPRPIEPTAELAGLASAMLAAVGGDLMRADVLEDGDGRLWALEINASFGFPHDDEAVLAGFARGFRRVAS